MSVKVNVLCGLLWLFFFLNEGQTPTHCVNCTSVPVPVTRHLSPQRISCMFPACLRSHLVSKIVGGRSELIRLNIWTHHDTCSWKRCTRQLVFLFARIIENDRACDSLQWESRRSFWDKPKIDESQAGRRRWLWPVPSAFIPLLSCRSYHLTPAWCESLAVFLSMKTLGDTPEPGV